ncbi:BPSS1780 family membrane protein [Kerstersia gyiorum]|uniref:Transmembrane protein n=1 Tax=Kerstersia gyiorum TaxID=206506 RepID=A0A171KUS3_9BURK|nr:BPSS1780 family membrane protein [Kerstersia gyiorum]KKO72640.1 hypothetical protein AAV32_06410 [Kerstersia gyiorum]
MQASTLPASAGWYWISQGYRLFRRQPLPLFTWMMFITMLGMLAMNLAPIGPLLAQFFVPFITVMTLSGCRALASGQPAHPAAWVQPLREPGVPARLLVVGGLQFGLILLAAMLAFMPFSDTLTMELERAMQEENIAPFLDAMRMPAIIFGVLYAGVSALFWFTPLLVAWHQLPVTRAIFFSLVACWRNKWAFLLYAATWGIMLYAVHFIANMLAFAMPGLSSVVAALAMAVNLFAAAVWSCSAYVNYATVFGAASRAQANMADGPGA